MTNEQILKKAIEKAVKNGYDFQINLKLINDMSLWRDIVKENLFPIIFSNSFAKAFWGYGDIACLCWCGETDHMWQAHIQQMVVEEDRLKYIEKFLHD